MRENSPSVTNSHKRTPKAHLTINNKNNKSKYSVKRYMPATGRASLLIIERTIMRRMENLNFYNVFHKAINKRISVIPYSFNISGMNGTFWLVTTCKVIQYPDYLTLAEFREDLTCGQAFFFSGKGGKKRLIHLPHESPHLSTFVLSCQILPEIQAIATEAAILEMCLSTFLARG